MAPTSSTVGAAFAPERKGWVEEGPLRAYLRFDPPGALGPTLVLVSVGVEEHLQGRGVFTAWLERAERQADAEGRILYVENIVNERLLAFLLRRGYREAVGTLDTCAYRPVPLNPR